MAGEVGSRRVCEAERNAPLGMRQQMVCAAAAADRPAQLGASAAKGAANAVPPAQQIRAILSQQYAAERHGCRQHWP